MNSLFDRYSTILYKLSDQQIANLEEEPTLTMDSRSAGKQLISMSYAPFDHVEENARVVIVGLTPGKQQARNALVAARDALRRGCSQTEAAKQAKQFASFSGSMRNHLITMLDVIGLPRWLGVSSTAALWGDASGLAHFTSALRYPVLVDGQNFSGQPDMLRNPFMTAWLQDYTGQECALFRQAVFVPLGPKVEAALMHLANRGSLKSDAVLKGLPHPSGANAERISCFLGRKEPSACSSKTDPGRLLAARADLTRQVANLG